MRVHQRQLLVGDKLTDPQPVSWLLRNDVLAAFPPDLVEKCSRFASAQTREV